MFGEDVFVPKVIVFAVGVYKQAACILHESTNKVSGFAVGVDWQERSQKTRTSVECTIVLWTRVDKKEHAPALWTMVDK